MISILVYDGNYLQGSPGKVQRWMTDQRGPIHNERRVLEGRPVSCHYVVLGEGVRLRCFKDFLALGCTEICEFESTTLS